MGTSFVKDEYTPWLRNHESVSYTRQLQSQRLQLPKSSSEVQNNRIFLPHLVAWKKFWTLGGSLDRSFRQPINMWPTFADGAMEEKPLCFFKKRGCVFCEWPPSSTQRRGTLQGDVAQSGSHGRLATGLGAEPCPPEQQRQTWASDLHEVPHLELCKSTTAARHTASTCLSWNASFYLLLMPFSSCTRIKSKQSVPVHFLQATHISETSVRALLSFPFSRRS